MIEHSFCHLPGIGPASEQKLWQQGIFTWQDALNRFNGPGKKDKAIRKGLEDSIRSLSRRDAGYFATHLPAGQQYRLFKTFRQTAVFLDIETTGLSPWDHITTIALWDGVEVKTYVRGENLEDFPADIEKYGLLVTYNGKTFDLPFIRSRMDIPLDQAHIDLRYVLGALGYKGGLKRCEKAFGIDRGDLDGVDGSFAVILWHEYKKTANQKLLETLLAYNVEDVINLEILMVRSYNMHLEKMNQMEQLTHPDTAGFGQSIAEPPAAPNPFSPDAALVERLAHRHRAFV